MSPRTVLLVVLCLASCALPAFAQAPSCNDAAIMSLRGQWIADSAPRPSPKEVTNDQYLQIAMRADAVHPLLLEAYPELVGMREGRWWHSGGGPSGVAQGLLAYNYIGALSQYFCAPNASPDSILGRLGAPARPVYVDRAAETNLIVHFNHFGDSGFLTALTDITVDGLPVFQRSRPTGVWKDHERYVRESSLAGDGLVLLTRKGMLPYRPVTRKQYLDHMVAAIQRQYDDTIAAAKAVLANPETSGVPEFAEGARQSIADAAIILAPIARFQEELKRNAAAKTLDSPAIVAGIGKMNFSEDHDIFATEETGGQALVTMNPDYIRRDLPPYVPQFIVVHWQLQTGVASAHFGKMVEVNLPIEKLQAMIDR